jgi:hypothetical protein
MLEASSLLFVNELDTDSWLLLLCEASRGCKFRSLEVVESKLPAGDPAPFGGGRTGGVLG